MRMRHTLLLCGAALALAACSATPTQQVQTAPTPLPADIRVEESIGFTIVETAEIDGNVRLDYERALGLLGQGRINDGIAVLETVVERAPELSAPRVDLAIAWHRLDDLDAAEAQLDQVLEINPQHPIALNELGIVYRKTARFAEARQSYEAALAVYPGYHYARRNLAVLCELYLADLECAADNYEAYMGTVHSDDEAAMWLRNVNYRLGRTE
jgi:Flp pilus assembly protein TadD